MFRWAVMIMGVLMLLVVVVILGQLVLEFERRQERPPYRAAASESYATFIRGKKAVGKEWYSAPAMLVKRGGSPRDVP